METIRSSYSIEGVKLFCNYINGVFVVESRWQRFHSTADINEALAVFEGLCMEELPTKQQAKYLILEARRNHRNMFVSLAAWEKRVIECALRRCDGLALTISGSKGAVEVWA